MSWSHVKHYRPRASPHSNAPRPGPIISASESQRRINVLQTYAQQMIAVRVRVPRTPDDDAQLQRLEAEFLVAMFGAGSHPAAAPPAAPAPPAEPAPTAAAAPPASAEVGTGSHPAAARPAAPAPPAEPAPAAAAAPTASAEVEGTVTDRRRTYADQPVGRSGLARGTTATIHAGTAAGPDRQITEGKVHVGGH
jgi:hypothetical protein